MKASVMLEKKKECATILAFDVKVTLEAHQLAQERGVKIFMADIIYHLFGQFKAYVDNIKEEKKEEVAEEAVFPCVLKIVPGYVYRKKDPIILAVDILDGIAREFATEFIAIAEGIRWAWGQGVRHLEIQCDSEEVVKLICSSEPLRGPLREIIEECRMWW